MTRSKILSEQQIEILHEGLSGMVFENLDLRPLISNEIYRLSLNGSGALRKSLLSLLVVFKKFCWKSDKHEDSHIPSVLIGRILCPLMNASLPHREMAMSIAQKLGSEACLVLCLTADLSTFAGSFPKISWDKLPIDNVPFNRALRCNFLEWFNLIRRSASKARAHLLTWPLMLATISALECIFRARVLLDHCKPSRVLVSFDRWEVEGSVVQVAKQLNIPTFTLVHGAMNLRTSYSPIIADRVLVWGESQRRRLLEWGVPETKISCVGYHRLTRVIMADRAKVLRCLGVAPEKRLVTVATDPLPQNWNNEYVRTALRAIEGLGEAKILLRLHPAERVDGYIQEFGDDPLVIIRENSELSLDEVMAASSVVLVRNSTIGGEALIKGRPVVVFQHSRVPLRYGRELVETAGAPLAENVEQLRDALSRIIYEPTGAVACLERAKAFVKDFACAYGEDATDNIVRELLSIYDGESIDRTNRKT